MDVLKLLKKVEYLPEGPGTYYLLPSYFRISDYSSRRCEYTQTCFQMSVGKSIYSLLQNSTSGETPHTVSNRISHIESLVPNRTPCEKIDLLSWFSLGRKYFGEYIPENPGPPNLSPDMPLWKLYIAHIWYRLSIEEPRLVELSLRLYDKYGDFIRSFFAANRIYNNHFSEYRMGEHRVFCTYNNYTFSEKLAPNPDRMDKVYSLIAPTRDNFAVDIVDIWGVLQRMGPDENVENLIGHIKNSRNFTKTFRQYVASNNADMDTTTRFEFSTLGTYLQRNLEYERGKRVVIVPVKNIFDDEITKLLYESKTLEEVVAYGEELKAQKYEGVLAVE